MQTEYDQPSSTQPRIGVFISFSGAGGVERMVMNLIREFARREVAVDLLTTRADSAHFKDLPANVHWIPLRANHYLSAIPQLAGYLRKTRPLALLAAKDRAGRAAVIARRFSGSKTPVVIRLGTNLLTSMENRSPVNRWLRLAPMKSLYGQVERIVAVSEGVAEDTKRITGLPASRIVVIRNPVITANLFEQAAAPCPHEWLGEDERRRYPLILAAGRLGRQKGFDTLLNAFGIVSQERAARLVILGEGDHRERLEAQAEKLGVADNLLLPGFQDNPGAWLSRADLFVLSSRWEGSPNVLTEALALGIPSVATDCPSGPRETLDGGRFGPLVAVDDAPALARAMVNTLERPHNSDVLKRAVAEYTAETSAGHYLEVLGLPDQGTPNAVI